MPAPDGWQGCERMVIDARVVAAYLGAAGEPLWFSPTTPERLTSIFRRVTGRTPLEADLRTLSAGLSVLLARYGAAPNDAAALLRQGTTPAPVDLDPSELAAWMLIANAVLNLDATFVRD